MPFVRNGFVEIYFHPIFGRQFRKVVLVVLKQCGEDCVILVAGQHLSIYRAVPLTMYMERNVNVNVNVDLCCTLSCELFGRLPNLKRWKLSSAHMPGR